MHSAITAFCYHPTASTPNLHPRYRTPHYILTRATFSSFLLPGGKPKKPSTPTKPATPTICLACDYLPTHLSTTARARTHQPHREQCSLIRGASRVFVCEHFLVDDLGSRQPVAGCCMRPLRGLASRGQQCTAAREEELPGFCWCPSLQCSCTTGKY